jgi:hypothetical protein
VFREHLLRTLLHLGWRHVFLVRGHPPECPKVFELAGGRVELVATASFLAAATAFLTKALMSP